jgi:arylsulfatase A-like enzyme
MMMLREPGRDRTLRIDTPVQPSDLYTTVLNYVLGEAERSSTWESRDLFEIARSGGEPRVVVTECVGPGRGVRRRMMRSGDPRVRHLAMPQVTAQDGRFKLLASGDGRRELYDLRKDPGERENVIQRYPEEADRLSS